MSDNPSSSSPRADDAEEPPSDAHSQSGQQTLTDDSTAEESVADRSSTSIDDVSDDEMFDSEGSEPLFKEKRGLFRKKEMVRVGWVPDGDRIVGRDDYISELSGYLNDAVFGGAPNHVSITGKTGTGKSLVARYVSNRAQSAADDDVNLGVGYIDCAKSSTETQVVASIGQKLNDQSFYDTEEDRVTMPDTGLPKDKFYKRLWGILDNYDSAIVILDEVDLLSNDRVLMNLAKAVEARETTCKIGLIPISNSIGYFEELNPRTKSAFHAEEMNFDPYDANDLSEILEGRRDAFYDGVLESGVIPLVAGLSAQEHGDARKAMRLFRVSGEVAERDESETVTESHVKKAQEQLEKDRFGSFLEGTPTQMKAASLSIAAMANWSNDDYIITGDIYELYKKLCSRLDMNQVSIRRFRDILGEMALHNVIETKEENKGRGGGIHNTHRLLHDPKVVRETVMKDTRFSDLSTSGLRDVTQVIVRS